MACSHWVLRTNQITESLHHILTLQGQGHSWTTGQGLYMPLEISIVLGFRNRTLKLADEKRLSKKGVFFWHLFQLGLGNVSYLWNFSPSSLSPPLLFCVHPRKVVGYVLS